MYSAGQSLRRLKKKENWGPHTYVYIYMLHIGPKYTNELNICWSTM